VGIASLGSGSRGNGTLVAIGGAVFLVDCGFTLKQAEQRLARLQLSPGDLSAILVSHEHSDHIAGVAALAHRYGVPVYASYGTLKASPKGFNCNAFDGDIAFELAGVTVNPVVVPHDAREPTQFVFEHDALRIGVLSDLGSLTQHVAQQFSGCHYLLLEANHDRAMLHRGSYPASLKRRVGGDLGHLSNSQALELLNHIAHSELHVVIGHISEQNNDVNLVEALFSELRPKLASLSIATQGEGQIWIGEQPITRQISFDKVM
jgi:phosphoribosyl 1,2-cyclic phosphodiesterase